MAHDKDGGTAAGGAHDRPARLVVPGGLVPQSGHLLPRLSRLNPGAYFKRLFSPKHLAGVLVSMLKAAALAGVLYWVVTTATTQYVQLQLLPLDEALRGGAQLLLHGRAWGVQCVRRLRSHRSAVADIYLPARAAHEQTRGPGEHKTNEGRPEVRQRIRKIQIQMARRTIRRTVPTADVVIVNPEHYAVALQYDQKRAQAPFLVRKEWTRRRCTSVRSRSSTALK